MTTFSNPDHDRFPALGLAYRALEGGESLPAVLNAANEVAVEAFLGGIIRFTEIPTVIERTMDLHNSHSFATIEDVLIADRWGRDKAREILGIA